MKRYYAFAGLELEVILPDTVDYDDHVLRPFRCDKVENPHRFVFEMAEQLALPEGERIISDPAMQIYRFPGGTLRYFGSVNQAWQGGHMRVSHQTEEHRVQLLASAYPGGIGGKTILNSIAAEHLIAQNGGFVFHCAYIGVDGKAVLFTAPSGTGKSTQADLWHELRNAPILNGDRSAVRMENGLALACGIPFAGSSWYCENVTLPLGAIVYLRQAPETTIRQLKGAEAFRKVWEGVSVNTWDRRDMENVSNTVTQVISSVPVFELACTPDESAIIALEGVLKT